MTQVIIASSMTVSYEEEEKVWKNYRIAANRELYGKSATRDMRIAMEPSNPAVIAISGLRKSIV